MSIDLKWHSPAFFPHAFPHTRLSAVSPHRAGPLLGRATIAANLGSRPGLTAFLRVLEHRIPARPSGRLRCGMDRPILDEKVAAVARGLACHAAPAGLQVLELVLLEH